MGDKKNGKKVVGIAMAVLMIASTFAMIAPASVAWDPPPPVQPGDYIVGADNGTFKCLMPATQHNIIRAVVTGNRLQWCNQNFQYHY